MTRFTTLLLCSVAFAVPTKHEVDPPCNLAKCLKLGAMCALAITQPALAGSALNGGSNALAAHQSQEALQKSAPALSVEGVRNRKLKNALTSPEMSPPTVEQMSSPPPLAPNAPLDFANMHVDQLSDYVIANPNMIKEVYNSISKKQGPGFYYSKYIQFYYVVVSDGNKQLVIAAPPQGTDDNLGINGLDSTYYSYKVATKPGCCDKPGWWPLVKRGGPINLDQLNPYNF